MANKDVLKITFDANAGIKELEQNLIGSMNGMSEEISKKLEEAFAKAGRNPKLKKQLTGIYQGLFDEFGSAAGDLKEIENAVDRFAGKIYYLNKVSNKSGNKGLLDNLSIENINKVLKDYDKLIEKQNEINRLQSNEFRDNKRSETAVKSLKELEHTYGDVGKAKEKYEDKVNSYLKNVGIETSAISKEIKEYSSLIALFDKISGTKVSNGSDEAIKKSQALLYVMQKITDLENGNTIFSKFRLNESDIKGITSSLTVLTQEVEGSITSLVNGMKRNLNKQISEIFENAVAEAEKMSQHQFKVDVKTQAKITQKNGKGSGTGTGSGAGDGNDIPEPEGFDVWTESAKELEDEFRDVIKYASDAETALARINEIWDKYANGKGKLLEGETDEMFALMKRLDSLVQNKVIDKSPLSKDQLEEFEPILWDDNYEKVFDRIDQLTSKQIARIEELKAAQKDVGDGSGSVGGVGNIDNSKVEELSKEIAEVKEDISSLKGRVDTLEDTTAFDTLSSKVEGFDEKIKNVDGSVENLVSAFKLLSELSLTDLQKVVIPFFNGINQLYKENNGNHISGYWDKLKEEIEGSNTELRELLKLVGLYDSKSNGLKIISDGMVNSGGLIGDDRVLIARKNKNDRLEQTQALKKALDEAHASGINVSRILDIIGTKESDVFLEVQETANGNILGNIYGQIDEDFVNTEWLEATDEQVKKLISDMIALQKMGINVESNLTNIMYDKEKGFSFIDMDLDITKFENDAELMEDHMIRIFGDLEDFYLNQNDTANANMIAKARERFEKLSEQVQQSYAEAQDSHSPSKEFEKLENDAVDGIVEGANKNEDRLKNVGKQMADNIKDGFKEGLSEIGTTSLSPENQSTVLSGSENIKETIVSYEKLLDLLQQIVNLNTKLSEAPSSPTLENGIEGKGQFLSFAEKYMWSPYGNDNHAAEKNIKAGYGIYTSAQTKFANGEVDQTYVDNAYTTFVKILTDNVVHEIQGATSKVSSENMTNFLQNILPKKMNSFIEEYVNNITSFNQRNADYHIKGFDDISILRNKLLSDLSELGSGVNVRDDEIFSVDAKDDLVELFEKTELSAENFDLVLNDICNILGVEIPQATGKAEQAIKEATTAPLPEVDQSSVLLGNANQIEDKIQDVGNGTKRIISEIGMSYDDFIQKVKSDNSLEERFAIFDKYGKVIDSFKGDLNSLVLPDNMNTSGAAKIVHSHPSMNALGGTFSEDDYLQWYSKFLSKGIGEQFELMWRGKSLKIDLSDIEDRLKSSVISALVNISHVAGLQLETQDGQIPLPLSDVYNSLSNGLLKNVVEQNGGSVTTDIIDEANNQVRNIETLLSVLRDFGKFRSLNIDNDDAIKNRIEELKSVLKFLAEHEEYTYEQVQEILNYEKLNIMGTNSYGLNHNSMQLKNDTAEWMSEYLANKHSEISGLSVNSDNFDPFNVTNDAEREYFDITCKYYDALAEGMDSVVRRALEGQISEGDFVNQAMASISSSIGKVDNGVLSSAFEESSEYIRDYITTRFNQLKTDVPEAPMLEITNIEEQVAQQSTETGSAIKDMISKFSVEEIEEMATALKKVFRGLIDVNDLTKSFGVTEDDLYTALDIVKDTELFDSLKNQEKVESPISEQVEQADKDTERMKYILSEYKDACETYFKTGSLESSLSMKAYTDEAKSFGDEFVSQLQRIYNEAKETFAIPYVPVDESIKDTFDVGTESSEMDKVATATDDAVQAKKDFAISNEGVQDSVDGSKSKLELEAELMESIATNARKAADAKKEFAQADKKVKDSDDAEKRKSAYHELIDAIEQYSVVSKRIAKNKAFDGDLELAEKLEDKISDLQKQPILSSFQIEDSERKLVRLFNQLDAIEKEMANKALSSAQNTLDSKKTDLTKINNEDREKTPEYETAIKNYTIALNKLETKIKYFNENGINTKDDIVELNNLENAVKEASDAIKVMSTAKKGYSSTSQSNVFLKIADLRSTFKGMSKDMRNELDAMEKEFRDMGNSLNVGKAMGELKDFETQLKNTRTATHTLWSAIKDKAFYGLAAQIGTYFGFNDVIQGLRQGFEAIKEFDTALTEMRKVSDETVSSLERFQDVSFDLADGVGTTAKAIQDATADWMRLGESLEEAKQSAQDANVLFRVSEFESIDEATESLVAMSAAYKDLEKSQINDVLNEIGNNYAISTDELASALQKSAATLSVAGNDIYEAAALVTAGNAVLQDADSVGTGLKMISLRILGTQEAKDELASLGEDVDDFVVQTKSKIDETVRNFTAVASNDFKGISVLDDNGNYRSTYEILRDISQVYQEILETDKKAGTNRGQALLEVLAGKNRSNVAASILQSPELLTSAYESAMKSAGSAQEELDKFLESIDGRMAKLENQAQEFWFKFIDSDTIKNGITLLTELLGLATDFVDTFGALGTAGAIGGGILGAKGLGLTNYIVTQS